MAAAITPRTRAICLVDPSNPYGTVAAPDEVAALTALAERHGLLLVHDVTHGAARHRPRRAAGRRAGRRARGGDLLGLALLRAWPARAWASWPGRATLMRGCLQLKAALTRLNTNLVSQRGALAALRDGAYRDGAETAIRANLAHLEQTLAGIDGLDLAVRRAAGWRARSSSTTRARRRRS